MGRDRRIEAAMSAPTSSRAPLPPARLVERRHRLAALPAPPLRIDLAPLAAPARALVAVAVGLWPLTAVATLALALVIRAGV
jgi:hypothetical protein